MRRRGRHYMNVMAHRFRLIVFDFDGTLVDSQGMIVRAMAQLGGWLAAGAPFRGKQIICYHKNWAYFEERFQVTCVDYVEAKPGIPPTPGHVAELIKRIQQDHIGVLLAASYFDRNKVETVASRGGAKPTRIMVVRPTT